MSTPAALSHHREVLAETRTAFAQWAAADKERRREIAESAFELLALCGSDMNGDFTLDAVSAIFEDHEDALPRELTRQLDRLARAAHAVGRGIQPETFRILAKRDGTGRLGPADGYTKGLGARPEEFRTREEAEARAEQYRRTARETLQSAKRSNPLSYTVVAVPPPTVFTVGDFVQSSVNAQGLKKGHTYEVVGLSTQDVIGDTYVTYLVVEPTDEDRPRQGTPIPVANGHLILTAVRRTSTEDEDA